MSRWMLCLALLLSLNATLPVFAAGAVEVREEPLTLPAYEVGPADINPRFFEGRGYQGAKGPVYPYPMLDILTQNKQDHTYTALYLENEYVRYCVLPEIGGRLFEAYDKTNDYNFFYRQHVIKPDLIGMLGAWISGGVEWCVFHHHRNTTFMPVDYTLAENKDGSKTIWIGETERRHRMTWLMGMTLAPGSSRLDVTVKLYNDTPYVNSFLYWANVAIHSTDAYQILFPPSTQYATFHGKNEFSEWPISHQKFNGMDYTQGVDVSWWKSHPKPSSFFAWNAQENFFAGYDHGLHAGVVHVADHNVVPGMKLWTWGTESTWDRTKLTDSDGPYAEIMVGAYSDNQPDYSWIQPHEVKAFTQSWYPLRDLEGCRNATRDAAVNLEITPENTIRAAFNTSAKHPRAHATVTAKGQTLLNQYIAIDPAHPFSAILTLPEGVTEDDLRATLTGTDGKELVSYQKKALEKQPMPEPVTPPPAPADIPTVEELDLAAQRLQQFYNPTLEPYPYYDEALKRDPDDIRANTAMGIDDCRRGNYPRAVERLERALARLTKNHTRPMDGAPHYYLGVALNGLENDDDARDAFNRAAWNSAWRAASEYALAELDCRAGDFPAALGHIEESIAVNARDNAALDLRATILRHLGKRTEAKAQAEAALEMAPLDCWAGNELYLLAGMRKAAEPAVIALSTLTKRMRGQAEAYLELAAHYGAAGCYDEAIQVLSRQTADNANTYPMLYYHQAYYTAQQGDPEAAAALYRTAETMPPKYCFPYRLESIRILRAAIAANPNAARAWYYLGNLLYDLQPKEAVTAWERAVALDVSLPTAHRNLGYAYFKEQKDYPKAIAEYEKSVAADSTDPRVFYELDQLYAESGATPETRLALLCKNQATTDLRSDLATRQIGLFVLTAQYDAAIERLATRHFDTWEGGTEIHDLYVEAHTLRGMNELQQNNAQAALADFEAALEYPANLSVDRPLNDPPAARTHLMIARAATALGDANKAQKNLEEAAAIDTGSNEFRYYKGLALKELGKPDDAKALFDALSVDAEKQLTSGGAVDFFMKFGEKQTEATRMAQAHYIAALGAAGNGDAAKAKEHLAEALKANPNHLWAKIELGML